MFRETGLTAVVCQNSKYGGVGGAGRGCWCLGRQD